MPIGGVGLSRNVNFFFILQLVVVKPDITLPSSFKQGCKCFIMVPMVLLFSYYPDDISNHNHVFNVSKALI